MRTKIILAFVSGVFVSLTVANFYFQSRFSVIEESYRADFKKRTLEKQYLRRNISYYTSLEKHELSVGKGKNLVVYYSGGACFSCLEDLLNLLKTEYGIVDRMEIYVSDSAKLFDVEKHNDVFSRDYSYHLYTDRLLYNLNDVLVFKVEGAYVRSVLEYRPEENWLFEKYFNELGF